MLTWNDDMGAAPKGVPVLLFARHGGELAEHLIVGHWTRGEWRPFTRDDGGGELYPKLWAEIPEPKGA